MTANWQECIAEQGVSIHAAADLLPDITEKERRELADDIKKNGIQIGLVILVEGQDNNEQRFLLDGRQRCAAVWEAFGAIDGALVLTGMICGGGPVTLKSGTEVQIAEPTVIRPEAAVSATDANPFPNFDPYAFVMSANAQRRHLNHKQKRELIAKLLKARPETSDRQIAATARASYTTVSKVRENLETAGDVPTVGTRTDSAGRRQPAKKQVRVLPNDGVTRETVGSEASVNSAYDEIDEISKINLPAGHDNPKGVSLDPWPQPGDAGEPPSSPEQEHTYPAFIAPQPPPPLWPGQRIGDWEKDAILQLISRLGALERDSAPVGNWPLNYRVSLVRALLEALKLTVDDLRQ